MIKMKDEGFEYLLSTLPSGPDKSCALHLLPRALDFVRERNDEFGTAQMQKHLKTGYSKMIKIIDALIALCVIEIVIENPRMYRVIAPKEELEYDVFFNGWEEIGREEILDDEQKI